MAEECFELVPHDRNKAIFVLFPFILLPAETDPVLEERCDKKNLGRLCNSSSSKVVLTLLTEILTVYVGLSAIYVQSTDFQLISGLRGGGGS